MENEYKKGIGCTYVDCNYFREHSVQFDMSAVCVTSQMHGKPQQVIIDNEDFEKLIIEYNRRKVELENLNK